MNPIRFLAPFCALLLLAGGTERMRIGNKRPFGAICRVGGRLASAVSA